MTPTELSPDESAIIDAWRRWCRRAGRRFGLAPRGSGIVVQVDGLDVLTLTPADSSGAGDDGQESIVDNRQLLRYDG